MKLTWRLMSSSSASRFTHTSLVPVPGTGHFRRRTVLTVTLHGLTVGAESLLRLPTCKWGLGGFTFFSGKRNLPGQMSPWPEGALRDSGTQSTGTKGELGGVEDHPPCPCHHPTNQHTDQVPSLRWGFCTWSVLWPLAITVSSKSFCHTAAPSQGVQAREHLEWRCYRKWQFLLLLRRSPPSILLPLIITPGYTVPM